MYSLDKYFTLDEINKTQHKLIYLCKTDIRKPCDKTFESSFFKNCLNIQKLHQRVYQRKEVYIIKSSGQEVILQ